MYRRYGPAVCLLTTLLLLAAGVDGQPLETLKAGVVKLYVEKSDGLDETGAGVVIGLSKGTLFILTAYHVVEDATSIQVSFDSERWNAYEAEVYRHDESMDLAAVLVRFTDPDTPPSDLPKYQIRAGDPKYNENVTAIGHPSDQLEWHPSPENVAQAISEDAFTFLITKSQSERGFSGGPVFDAGGALMGIVVSVTAKQTKVVLSDPAIRKLRFWKVPINHLVEGDEPDQLAEEDTPAEPDPGKPDITEAPPETGTIVVKTRPDTTRVRLGKEERGVTEGGELTIEDVEPGEHMLYVLQEGYRGWRDKVEVRAGAETLVSVQLLADEPAAEKSQEAIEADCFRQVQGRIAWDYTGNKQWVPANIERLCKGTSDAIQPPGCFSRVMTGGVDMGRGTRWRWQEAVDLCEGTQDARRTIDCFVKGIRRGLDQKAAIDACTRSKTTLTTPITTISTVPKLSATLKTKESTCFDLVQDKIAWDYKGNKRWATSTIERLCKGTSDAGQPPACFNRVMHGRVDMGKGTRWRWQEAVDLCEGTDDASRTVACFEAGIARGKSQQEAIEVCSK